LGKGMVCHDVQVLLAMLLLAMMMMTMMMMMNMMLSPPMIIFISPTANSPPSCPALRHTLSFMQSRDQLAGVGLRCKENSFLRSVRKVVKKMGSGESLTGNCVLGSS
jgi:hypothetical protein